MTHPAMPLDISKAIPFWAQMSHHDVGFCLRLLNRLWHEPGNCFRVSEGELQAMYREYGAGGCNRYGVIYAISAAFWWHPRDEMLHSPYILELVGRPQPRASIPGWTREEVRLSALRWTEDGDIVECHYCGDEVGADYHLDHALPVARGGINHPQNLRVSCPTCNFSKGMRTEREFGWWDSILDRRIHSLQELTEPLHG